MLGLTPGTRVVVDWGGVDRGAEVLQQLTTRLGNGREVYGYRVSLHPHDVVTIPGWCVKAVHGR